MNRNERRRQLKEDDKSIARGLDPSHIEGRHVIALMRALDDKLQVCLQRRSVSPLMQFVYANMTSGARFIRDVPIACRRGCSHCCHSWVDATAAEVLFAVKSIAPAQRSRAVEGVDRACQQTEGRPFEIRSKMVTACALLEDGCCSAYSVRPLVCRSAVSADAEVCRRSYLELNGEPVPVPVVWRSLGQAYAVALEGAILHSGLVATAREWNESLRTALNNPDSEPRWLAGEDVFSGVPRASTASNFDGPVWATLYREVFGILPPTYR